jgi:hypothetical protein
MHSMRNSSRVFERFFFQKFFMESAVLSGRMPWLKTLAQNWLEFSWRFFWLVIISYSLMPSIIVYFFFLPILSLLAFSLRFYATKYVSAGRHLICLMLSSSQRED